MWPPLQLWIVCFSAHSLQGTTFILNQLSNSYSSKGGQLKRVQIGQLRNLWLEIWWKRSEGTQWEGGSQRDRKVSWMFKILVWKAFEGTSTVSKKAQLLGGQTMITDYRGEKWRGAGSSNFFWRTLMSFHFFWRSENTSFTPTPTLRPFLLSSTRARTLAQRTLWAVRTLIHFHHFCGCGSSLAWERSERESLPFCWMRLTHSFVSTW